MHALLGIVSVEIFEHLLYRYHQTLVLELVKLAPKDLILAINAINSTMTMIYRQSAMPLATNKALTKQQDLASIAINRESESPCNLTPA